MKRLLILTAFIISLHARALAMIDDYTFKIIGRIVSVSEKQVNDPGIKDELLQNPYYIKLEIVSIIPTEKDIQSWTGRYQLKGQVNINRVESKIGDVKPGEMIIGFLHCRETEFHRHGYRVDNFLEISGRFSDETPQEFFLKQTEEIAALFGSGNIKSMINAVIVARENKVRGLAPIILEALNKYYPQGKWAPPEAWDLYNEGIRVFKAWGFKESLELLEKIVRDKENEGKIGIDFRNIQKEAKDAIEIINSGTAGR